MPQSTIRLALTMMSVLCGVSTAQQPTILQTPRQAVIEMIGGGEAGLRKHLTVEVQNKVGDTTKDTSFMSTVAMARAAGLFQTFDSGPVLFLIDNAQQHEKIEVRIENDSLRGDTDTMELSFHASRDGRDEPLPVGFRVIVNLKQQTDIWRLNALTFSVRLPVGDPKFYDPSIWSTALLAGRSRAIGFDPTSPNTPDAPPKIPPARAMRLIGLAENAYAQKHPEAGFTCNLTDLVNIGRGNDEGRPYSFLEAELGGGVYNGYKFTVSGCGSKPVSTYQVVAEPLAGAGKTFCSDATRSLRAAENGDGATCLASGRPTNR